MRICKCTPAVARIPSWQGVLRWAESRAQVGHASLELWEASVWCLHIRHHAVPACGPYMTPVQYPADIRPQGVECSRILGEENVFTNSQNLSSESGRLPLLVVTPQRTATVTAIVAVFLTIIFLCFFLLCYPFILSCFSHYVPLSFSFTSYFPLSSFFSRFLRVLSSSTARG